MLLIPTSSIAVLGWPRSADSLAVNLTERRGTLFLLCFLQLAALTVTPACISQHVLSVFFFFLVLTGAPQTFVSQVPQL